jgi:hypothetical protein
LGGVVRVSAWRRSGLALGAVLIFAVALGGCAILRDITELNGRIERAGYTDVSTNHSTVNGLTTITITANTVASRRAESEDVEEIAKIVWETYPRDFDRLQIELNGRQADELTRDDLEAALGPRPAQLVRDDNTLMIVLIVVLSVFLVLIAAIVLIVILLVRRQSRRARQMRPNAPYPGPAPPGWPPPPPPGYSAPPPPGYSVPPPGPPPRPPSDPNP